MQEVPTQRNEGSVRKRSDRSQRGQDERGQIAFGSSQEKTRELNLVRRAAEGDMDSQAELVQLLMPRVRKISRVFFRETADADDVSQLSLLAILKSLPSFRGESSFAYWAKRITVRTTMRYLERERRKQRPLVGLEVELLQGVDLESSQERLPRDLREYLEELPKAQRDAMVLHHALGYSIRELSALINVSPNTVKGRLRLGAASLRRRMRQEIALGRIDK